MMRQQRDDYMKDKKQAQPTTLNDGAKAAAERHEAECRLKYNKAAGRCAPLLTRIAGHGDTASHSRR
jgi:hypothetical protein